MRSATSTIENGFVYLPEKAEWLAEYLHEMAIFPNGKFDDQVDSTSQALDWVRARNHVYGLLEAERQRAEKTTVDPRVASLFTRPRFI